MNAKLKMKWVKALRGGQYKQSRSTLCNGAGTKFCCLGVLADIQGALWEPDGLGDLRPVTPIAQKVIAKTGGDWLSARWSGGLTSGQQSDLAGKNDAGDSFAEIADYIEANL